MNDTIFLDPCNLPRFIPREQVNPSEKWIKHVVCNGARFHVIHWEGGGMNNTRKVCSEPDCIINKPKEQE